MAKNDISFDLGIIDLTSLGVLVFSEFDGSQEFFSRDS